MQTTAVHGPTVELSKIPYAHADKVLQITMKVSFLTGNVMVGESTLGPMAPYMLDTGWTTKGFAV